MAMGRRWYYSARLAAALVDCCRARQILRFLQPGAADKSGLSRPCLASESGTDLRALPRSGADDAALLQAIQNTILAKPRNITSAKAPCPPHEGRTGSEDNTNLWVNSGYLHKAPGAALKMPVPSRCSHPGGVLWAMPTAADWHRQVSLLSWKRLRVSVKSSGWTTVPLAKIWWWKGSILPPPAGAQLFAIGDAVLEMTDRQGAHSDCAIRRQTGDCIMPREWRVRTGVQRRHHPHWRRA
ncbi:MAG: hypothetical protein ACLVJH_17775 [Faecalibacterium prausnitzii]